MMIEFLVAAAVAFGLCWVWVGGYIADFFIWIISKLTPDTSDEKLIAFVAAGIFLIIGIIAAVTQGQESGAIIGGAIVGVGAYVAVRLPGKIRVKRENKAAKSAARAEQANLQTAQPLQAAPTMQFGQPAQAVSPLQAGQPVQAAPPSHFVPPGQAAPPTQFTPPVQASIPLVPGQTQAPVSPSGYPTDRQ
ncbi:MAG: hypothetical protein LBI64_02210 [Coriobacteriales bacterium]|jgi:hypothetical protein|nr:hypothetical protein [Coriobacteriales bacterium]